MLPHPRFEIPDAFLQPDDRCPLPGDSRLLLNNQCLQVGDHEWYHSTERAPKATRHPYPAMTP